MDEDAWLQEELTYLLTASRDYKQKALILGIKELLAEQQKRTEQLQGRLDGELWSPSNWE